MAIREQKGRAKPWQTYWNNPITGRRESANFATRKEAEKHDSIIRHRLKYDRESFAKAEEEDSKAMSFESLYLLYLKEKQFDRKSLLWQMDCIRPALKRFGTKAVSEIKKDEITEIMEAMKRTGVKPVTVKKRMSALKTVFRWIAGNGYGPMPDFPKLPSGQYEKFIPPSQEELAAIMAVAQDHIARVIILGAQLGVRVGPCELLRLTWDDVDMESRVLRVHGAKKNLNAPWREVPIRNSLVPVFAEWRKRDLRAGISHLVHYKGRPIQSIKTAWRATLKRAGISRKIRPYDLRHAFGTEMVAAGVDVGTVAKLMGHSTPIMLLNHYQYVMDQQKRAAVEAMPDVPHVPKPCAQMKRHLRLLPQVPEIIGAPEEIRTPDLQVRRLWNRCVNW